jgi:hypothetical protein
MEFSRLCDVEKVEGVDGSSALMMFSELRWCGGFLRVG